jgi:hypothetical protein
MAEKELRLRKDEMSSARERMMEREEEFDALTEQVRVRARVRVRIMAIFIWNQG